MTEQVRRSGRAVPANRGGELKRSSGRRKRKRRLKDSFIIVCALTLLIAVGGAVSLKFLFKADTVAVENTAERYTNEKILEVAGIETGKGLFAFSAKKVAEKIEKELPYVGVCTVKRRLPDTVALNIEYTRPFMAAKTAGGYLLIDKNGKALELAASLPSDYIAVLNGITVTEGTPGEKITIEGDNVFQYITMLSCAFDENGVKNITAFTLDANGEVTVEIDYVTDLKLGALSKAASKVRFAKEVLADNITPPAEGDRTVIDLTDGTKAYVRSQRDIEAASEAASLAAEADISGTKPDVPNTLPESAENTTEKTGE